MTGLLSKPVVRALLLFLLGVGSRAPFLNQGFACTDEGWLQVMGRRILGGEVPYRDFYYLLPPTSIYKEALLELLFGVHYTLLLERWIFSIEAAAGAVAVYLLLRKWVSEGTAFAAALPNTLFTVILFYFSSYNYDGSVLMLLGLCAAVYLRNRIGAVLGGALIALAAGSKTGYLVLPLALLALMLVSRISSRSLTLNTLLAGRWRWLWTGFGAVTAGWIIYLAAEDALGAFYYNLFQMLGQGRNLSLLYVLFQDWPTILIGPLGLVLIPVVAILALAVRAPSSFGRRIAQCASAALLVWLFVVFGRGGLILEAGLICIALALWELVSWTRSGSHHLGDLAVLALTAQYGVELSASGLNYSYSGLYLGLALALLVLLRHARQPLDGRIAAAVLGVWAALAALIVLFLYPYMEAPRSQLTAQLHAPKLAGIYTTPHQAQTLDAVVAQIDAHSDPDQRVLVIDSCPALYYASDRQPATAQTWFYASMTPPAVVDRTLGQIQQDPPPVVVVETTDEEQAISPEPRPVDYAHEPTGRIYRYVQAHYRLVARVNEFEIYVPGDAP